MAKRGSRIFEAKYFGLILGLLVFGLIFLVSEQTLLIDNLELKVLDFNFRLKSTFRPQRIQEGVTIREQNPNVSPDIVLVGIDEASLDRFGRWPFPRYRTADLLLGFARIANQNLRETAVFLDLFFNEPGSVAEDDARLVRAIAENGRVFLETVLDEIENPPNVYDERFNRQELLYGSWGQIGSIHGDWTKVETFRGVEPPLKPVGRAARAYGHANFIEDPDQVYRRQGLIVKLARLVEEIPLEEVSPASLTAAERENHTRLAWVDTDGLPHDVDYPLTQSVLDRLRDVVPRKAPPRRVDTDGDRTPDKEYYVVRKYHDSFIPAITLSLALQYYNKTPADLDVILGERIRIPSPQVFNPETGAWEKARRMVKPAVTDAEGNIAEDAVYRDLEEIIIPIDENGRMLVNFMGLRSTREYQTYTLRSYAAYAANPPVSDPSTWRSHKGVVGNILMVGAFAKGIAEDEKTTPFGLMYGVEIHANALNTILMDKHLRYVPAWVDVAILFGLVALIAFLVSRMSTLWSLGLSVALVVVHFFTVSLLFELNDVIVNLTGPIFGILFTFLAVVAYRTATEEKDKARIRSMFGRYVSPAVVDQILSNPPELGGVDKELTVFFSDIRGFTTLSENMTPQELVNHLNLYLTAMTDVILEYRGTLDKYVGDEVMCFWGAPLPQADHAILACKCSLRQMRALDELNASFPEERRIAIGIGLNSGIMTVGNMGSMGRMNYTLTGDNVNLGARLEGTNKQYGTSIIISEYTYGLVKDQVIVRELDNIRVKGKNRPVLIYELVDVVDGIDPPPPIGDGARPTPAAKKA
jgi:adenylate cyclase